VVIWSVFERAVVQGQFCTFFAEAGLSWGRSLTASPSYPPKNQNDQSARRQFLQTASTGSAAAAVALLFPALASAEVVVPEQSKEYTFPTDWGLTYTYDTDAARVCAHMVTATGLAKGTDRMEDFGKNLKKGMIDFVSYYRRFPQVAGKPSFLTLHTSINVLAGHYMSYGYKYPLPEKRRKLRLCVRATEITCRPRPVPSVAPSTIPRKSTVVAFDPAALRFPPLNLPAAHTPAAGDARRVGAQAVLHAIVAQGRRGTGRRGRGSHRCRGSRGECTGASTTTTTTRLRCRAARCRG
jgi:photosystem II Psb27 protein